MKKVMVLLLVVFVLAYSTAAFAANEDIGLGMSQKFSRGFINTFTGWIEIPAQIAKGYEYGWMGKENTGVVGAIGGIFAGIGSAVGRTLSGVGEMIGCWAADPESNEGIGIPLDAEYAWQQGETYDMVDPGFEKATTRPILYKLGRGTGNFAFGIGEIPGQIMIGIEEKSWDAGITKGIWYFLSREIDGAFDLATFFLPGPSDTKGYAFTEKWPWSAIGDRSTLDH